MNDKVKKLYDHFKSIGATRAKDANEFSNWMKGEKYRRNIYGILSEAGAEGIGKNFDEFSNITGYGKTNPVTSQAMDFAATKNNRELTWQDKMSMQGTINSALNNNPTIKPTVKQGLDTNRLNQENYLANSAMAQNMERNQDNIYLDELEKKAVELQKQGQAEVEKQQESKDFLGNVFDAVAGARTGVSQYQQNLQSNEKIRQGTLIQKNVEDARKAIRDAEISQNGSWYEKLGRGLANGFDLRNFDGGVTNMQNMLTLYDSATNNNPSDIQQSVLDSEALKNKIIKENEDKISNWITTGETTTMMFPFMVQIASNPFEGIGRASSNWILGKIGQQVASNLGKKAALLALKGSTRLLGTAIEGAGANVVFNSANIVSDTFKRNMGNAVGSYGSDGVFHYNEMQDGENNFAKSFLKAFGASTIEYQSELVGEYFAPIAKGIGKWAKKGIGKVIPLDKTINQITSLSNKQYMKAFNDFRKATHWDGVIGEYAEEVVGNIENAAFIGDMNFGTGENGVFNPEQNWETFMSVAVGSGFMGAIGGVSYMGSRIAVNRGLKKADSLGEDMFGIGGWNSIKEQIESSDNPAMTVSTITANLDPVSKMAVQNYVGYSMAKKGELIADMKKRMEEPQPTSSRVVPYKGKYVVQSVAQNGNILESKEFENEEDANLYQYRVNTFIDNNKKVAEYNNFLMRDTDGSKFAELGISEDEQDILRRIAYTEPLKRTDEEQQIFDNFINSIQGIVYPPTEVNEEHEAQNGADIAGNSETVDPNAASQTNGREAAAMQKWKEIISRDPDIENLINSLSNKNIPTNEIAQRLIDDGYSSDVVAAYCEVCNSKISKQAYINKIGENINNAVEQHVSEAMFAGQVNGQEDKSNIYQFTDGINTLTLVGGNVTNENGEFSSDGLIVLRDNNGNFVQRDSFEGLSLQGVVTVEQYRQNLLIPLQENATEVIMATEYNDSDMETSQPVAQESNGLTVPEQKTEEAPMPEVPTSNVQEQSEQKQDYPRDENNNLIYDQVPLEVTINDLYDGTLSDEEIRSLVGNNVSNAQKEYEKVQKKAPKIGTDKNKYLEEQKKHKSTVEEAKRKLDYWKSVDDYIKQQTHTTEAEIQKAKDELSGSTAQAEYEKNKSDVKNPVQVAGAFIKNAKIQPESFKKETGYGVTEQRAFSTMISNNGKTIDQLAEDLVSEDNSTNNGAMFHNDTMEAKNAIIEALQGGRQNLGKNTTDDFKEFERNRTQEREDYYQERYGMSYEDFLAFEEQMMPSVWQKMSNFVPEEYDRIVAESYEMQDEANNVEQINNEENGNNTEASEQLAGGTEVLPKEGSNQQGGTTVGANERREDENGGEGGNQNGEVQGRAQVVEIQPSGEGDFGPIYDQFKGDAKGAVAQLSKIKNGEATAALHHKDIGDIDLVWGEEGTGHSDGFGLAKLVKYHPEVVDNLQDILDEMSVVSRSENRVNLESEKYKAGIRLTWNEKKKTWLLTLFEKKNSAFDNTTDTDETVDNGKLNDTATQQNTVSDSKDTTISDTNQENQQKIEEKVDEQPKDDIDAEIKKDIEAFIAEPTHDVQITEYDEKEYEAKISVDGKPSNIAITPPMENGEGINAEYRPTEGSYQELGDLLDEYNETVDPNQQGLAGEHLAAIFTSVDAAIAFEDWVNKSKRKPETDISGTGAVDGKQTTLHTITEQDIDADEIADENAKELAKDFLRGENTGTIAELFYREIAARAQKKGEKKEVKKPAKEDDGFNEYIKNIEVVNAPFPNDITADNVLSSRHNKVGKRGDTYSTVVGIKGNDLYVKAKIANTTSEFVVKNALSYGANDIALRLDYAGITSDEARLAKDLVLELYNKKGLEIQSLFGFKPTLKPLFTDKTERPKQEKKSDTKQAFDEFKDVMKKFRNAGRIDANVSLVGLNARQIEMLADVFRATAKLGYAMVKDGATMFNDWLERMKAMVGETIKENSPWNDQDITDLLTETWNNKYLVDGVRKPLSEWAAEEAVNAEQEQSNEVQKTESSVQSSNPPFTKEELEAMTKEQIISAMWQKVFPVLCEKYKLPSDEGAEVYWFAPKMTKGYDKDSLVAACMKYMERINDEVQLASEKQMNYIMKLAESDEKPLFKDIILTKAAASRVIDLLKMEESMINMRTSTADDFEQVRNELEAIARLNGADFSEQDRKNAERTFVSNVTKMLGNALETGEKPYKSILDLRKAAKEAGMEVDDNGKTDIKLQELVEDAIVSVARNIMDYEHIKSLGTLGNNFSKSTFERIKKLYELQPTIAQRSSERVRLQQYSTPLPMAFVADMFIMKKLSPMFFNVLEPTAGNGMLVFGIPSRFVHANEIDKNRLENLRGQNFKEVTEQDATQPFEGGKIYNAVIANPPFGSAEAKNYDGKEISGLDPQIAINALESMKDKGRAAIIIGGKTEFRENGAVKNNVPFLTYLYDHYNVVGVVDMDGQLYAKQGTTYPTRMILINGRRSEEERAQSTVYPPVKDKWTPTATTFDELYDIVDKLINSKQKTNGTEILRGSALPIQPTNNVNDTNGDNSRTDSRQSDKNDANGRDGATGTVDSGRGTEKTGNNNKERKAKTPRVSVQPSLFPGDTELSVKEGDNNGNETRTDEGQQQSTGGTEQSSNGSVRGAGTTTSGVGLIPNKEEKRELSTEKLSYRRHNSGFSLQSVAPAAMVEAMDNFLNEIEQENGNIDDFVTKELGYKSVDEMHNALAAEQIDSVAMAIYQMKKGQAMIIGDQTGVGKGRQMAALIRWATLRGTQPIFITQKADLFSDIYRDLVDIGSGDLKPFIFNSDGAMVDANGVTVHKPLSATAQNKIFNSGELPAEYDFAVLTYSQVNTGDEISQKEMEEAAKKRGERVFKKKKDKVKSTPKATFLRSIAKDNYMFLDESHTAAGQSNTGAYLQSIVKSTKAVTFASATFAKRPDTMPLYALRTAMSKANVETNELISIIEKGGVTLQEIMSRALTDAGQMVRRERDMSDVKTDWKTITDEETVKKARSNYDKTIKAFNAIIDFQNNFVKPYINNLSEGLSVMASSAGVKQGTDNMGISNVPFASKTYNYTKQLMLALKVDAVVDEVEAEIKAGRHPVIALESTMESSYKDDFNVGDVIEEPTFSASLMKGLNTILQYTVTDEDGKKTHVPINPVELGESAEKEYEKLIKLIRESTSDIYISPLDAIIQKLRAKGYKVGELTGRNTFIETNENGETVVSKRVDKDKKKMQRDFNSGALDVLILNKSASTGISLHASEKFSDQRQRSMIIAQPLSDINDYMQMIGRIDRTGQVHRGYYINLGLPVPAENRFLMMLSTKLKSLNANTTTSQDSESSDVDAPDLLNKYGSQVVVEYLRDNPDIYYKLGEPLRRGMEKVTIFNLNDYISSEDDARKITGYVALLSTDEQDAFYNEVIERYNALIKYLNETGSNDLKINVLPLKAKTLEKKVSSPGVEPNGNNPFAKDAYLEKVEMEILKKPMKASEVRKTIDSINKGKQPEQALKEILDTVQKETEERFKKEEERMKNLEEKSKQNLAKQVERIYNNDKLDVKQKAEKINEITKESNEKLTESRSEGARRINDNRDMLNRRFKMFTVGNTYLIPDDLYSPTFLSASPAIFCGYKTKNEGVTLSTSFAVFAVLDGRRKIEIKLSDSTPLSTIKKHTEDNFAISLETSLDNWDSAIPSSSRKEGYILTGNILQAVNDSQREGGGYTGQLVSYTDIDGNIKDGILMPDSWQPSMMVNSGYPISTELINLREGKVVKSKDGKIEIKKGEKRYGVSYYELYVPKSKKEGAKFYQNEEILSLVEDRYFYQSRGFYLADVDGRNLEKLLDVLSRLGVKVDKENEEETVKFRLREDPAPKNTGIGYKVFVLKNGKLYPPMVANPNGADTPVGVWLDADAAPISGQSKTGRPQVKAGGKGTQGGSGQLAYRPGWHLGVIPYALQFNRKNPETGERELFPNNFVWAEVEYANDVDYQEEARKEGISASGKYQHSLAGLKRLPVNGSYMYRTNPDPRTDPWVITGAMKVNRMLKPSEVDDIVRNAGREPQRREEGSITDEEIEKLNEKLSQESDKKNRNGNPDSNKSGTGAEYRRRAEELVKKLKADGFVEITTSDKLEGERANARGFFEPKTGKVVIVIDNHGSWVDVEETILHEIVGHKGLRGLLGNIGYRKLMDAIWSNLTEEQKKELKEKAVKNKWQYYTAMDEYLAEQAEKMAWDKNSHTLWQNIRHYITEALRKLGFMIMPNYKDVRYWLWLSYNNLKSDDVMSEMKRQAFIYKLRKMPAPKIEWDVNYKDYTEPDILEREGDYSNTGTWQAIEERLTNNAQYWKESFIDYMNAYKIFQYEMAKGINGPLLDNMNAYIGENQISSKIAELQDQFLKNDVKKMQEQVNSVASEFGTGEDGIRGVEQYLYMKHGLERNRVLFMRDWFKENIDKKINDAKELPEMAQEIYDKMVASIETRFEDGDISEDQKNRMLDNAPQAAWIRYVNEAFDGFSRLHYMASTAVEQGKTTLQQMYNDLDSYINDYADFDADKMDKSGISSMTEYYVDGKFSDNAIIEQVESIERMLGDRRKKLWEAVNTVTQKGLDYDYMSGIVGEEAYNRAKSMFRWYVPLRGFGQKTMEDQYNYMQNSKGIGKKSLVTANGRTTLARSPLSVATDMALSAIRRGEINMNKQRAYRLVNRWQKENPDALAPATVVDVWYEVTGTDLNNNPTIEMAVPNINDDMDAEQIREAIIDFNEKMISKYAKGLAMKDKIPASFVRPFESNNHKNEHIVFVYLNGRQKMIVFNGNPRPAQALNGELKPTSSDGVIKKTMRVMAAAFTSYNPTFVVTNLSRDTIFANNNIAIKESYRYWKKFTGNQAKLIGGLAPNLFRKDNTYNKLWSDYNKGIEPTTELGRYFVEFMQNGGKTGFVNQMKIEELEKMIYSGDKKSAAVRGLSWVAGIIENMNDRVENVNRFAAYVTSRQMGRSVMRSISDAKEASVNFNRKGAGKSTGNGENPSKAAQLAGSIGNAFRSNYLFFNAGVQSFYTLARNTNKFPFKTSAFAMGVPFILGSFMIPLLNKIIGSLVGDDGDDEYANIPEWTRRNNICIYCGGGKWAKTPLPIELRAFYGLGDIAAGYTFDERLKSTNPLPIDMTSQLSQILPLDFMGEGGNVLGAFVPDVVKPITQIMTNTDWTGKPIQKATTPFNQYDPEYTKAFKYEFEPFVDFSKWINNHTGGTDVSKGWYDGWWNSPAYWNHLIGAYGGGFMQDLMRFGKLGKRAVKFDWEDASMKEVPIFKAMFETPTERTQYYRVMNKFQMYRDEAAKTKHDLNKWKKSEDPLLKARYDHDTYEATKTNEVKRMELVDKYLKEEKRLTKLIENKKTSETVKKAKKEELTRKKIDLVNQLDQIE